MVRKRKYTPEFRAEAVKLVKTSEKPLAHVAKDLGIPEGSLYQWVRAAEKTEESQDDAPLSENERAELKRLRRENERLQMEREFLKKAAAFFAKENQ